MKYLVNFPLFFLLLVAYNIVMLSGDAFVENPRLFRIPLMANDEAMHLHVSDTFVMIGIILLYFEILKAARISRSTIIEHALSMVVFIVFLIEFIVVAGAGTATFMILTLMALLDVVAGFTITISTARRDIGLSGGTLGGD